MPYTVFFQASSSHWWWGSEEISRLKFIFTVSSLWDHLCLAGSLDRVLPSRWPSFLSLGSLFLSPGSRCLFLVLLSQAEKIKKPLLFLAALFHIVSIICHNFDNCLFKQSSYSWRWMCYHFPTSGILLDLEVIKEMITIKP